MPTLLRDDRRSRQTSGRLRAAGPSEIAARGDGLGAVVSVTLAAGIENLGERRGCVGGVEEHHRGDAIAGRDRLGLRAPGNLLAHLTG
jgi:hypothetical protein